MKAFLAQKDIADGAWWRPRPTPARPPRVLPPIERTLGTRWKQRPGLNVILSRVRPRRGRGS